MTPNLITLRVWGDFACFTRPEMKVERVSYPVMTPSAARGILEAVFWEPQMYYLIDSIRIVKKGCWISFRRNEVTKVISVDSAKAWMRSPDKSVPIQAGGGAVDGTQRNMLALEDVEYLITAEVRLTSLASPSHDPASKYLAEIQRRAALGKCFHRPALGMREFAADFEWERDPDEALIRRSAELGQAPGQFNEDVGIMLYDVFDHGERKAGFRWLRDEELAAPVPLARPKRGVKRGEQPRSTGTVVQPRAAFFRARIEQSKLDCHPDRVQILASATGGR
ncbi:MAG: type I-C CRISPR-associated protein Cas5c [Candidatus Korobacteraceae bacterium]